MPFHLRNYRAPALLAVLLFMGPMGPSHAADDPWVNEARTVAAAVPPKLINMLSDAIAASGPDGAIAVCRDKAPAMARAASEQTGWQIRRVSQGNRNPLAVPDAWEASVLADFDRRAAAGEDLSKLERHEVVTTDGVRQQRYLKALPTQQLCTSCHGKPDDLAPGVAARLRELYPNDRATGYQVGQIRGALALRRPAP